MVINWDCPRRSDDYIHRVGRTARAGRGGVAVTIVTERDVELVQVIEKDIGVELVEMELPEETVLEKMNQVSLARRMATMVGLVSTPAPHYPHPHLYPHFTSLFFDQR